MALKHSVNCETCEIFKTQHRKLSQLVLAPQRAAASVYCEFHFHSSRLIIAFSAPLFFISFHVQFHVAEAKREKRKQREKNRQVKEDGVHIIGAVGHRGRVGRSLHPSLRSVISLLSTQLD